MKKNLKSLGLTTTAGLAASSASATIIHTTLPEPLLVGAPTELFFNLEDQVTGASDISDGPSRFVFSWETDFSPKPTISSAPSGGIASVGAYVSRFDEGNLISSTLDFSLSSRLDGYFGGNFRPGTRGYLGLRFDNDGTDNFGWVDVEYNSSNELVLYSFAYDDSGNAIQAGAIPEPRTSALLAALVAGSAAMFARRRKAVCADG